MLEKLRDKTKDELNQVSEGFCKDYVNKKDDTGILSGKWWIESTPRQLLEIRNKKRNKKPFDET